MRSYNEKQRRVVGLLTPALRDAMVQELRDFAKAPVKKAKPKMKNKPICQSTMVR